MKKTLHHLPTIKRKELKLISKRIQEVPGVEKIILFGSYARGNWVEEPGKNGNYKYQSDFDLLVIVDDKKLAKQWGKWNKVEDSFRRSALINTPVCLITDNIQHVNHMLSEGQFFFSDIVKEGILIYDAKKYKLEKEQKSRNPEVYKKKAEKYFEEWYNSANGFYRQFRFAFENEELKIAAFELHQATERYYSTILMVFTSYKPKSHDIEKLGKMASAHEQKLMTVFPRGTEEKGRLFNLLRSAYVDARYDENYRITRKELEWLAKRVSRLQKLTGSMCKRKIKEFTKGKSCR